MNYDILEILQLITLWNIKKSFYLMVKKIGKEIAEIILTEMYKSAVREPPEWIKYFVQETQT